MPKTQVSEGSPTGRRQRGQGLGLCTTIKQLCHLGQAFLISVSPTVKGGP